MWHLFVQLMEAIGISCIWTHVLAKALIGLYKNRIPPDCRGASWGRVIVLSLPFLDLIQMTRPGHPAILLTQDFLVGMTGLALILTIACIEVPILRPLWAAAKERLRSAPLPGKS